MLAAYRSDHAPQMLLADFGAGADYDPVDHDLDQPRPRGLDLDKMGHSPSQRLHRSLAQGLALPGKQLRRVHTGAPRDRRDIDFRGQRLRA
jgi:hypothetical protein